MKQLEICPPSAPRGIYSTLARVPDLQLLYVGPLVCMRHGLANILAKMHGRMSFLYLEPEELAVGSYFSRVREACARIITTRGAKCLVLVTGCVIALTGADFGSLADCITEETGVPTVWENINRLNMYAKVKERLISPPPGELIYSLLQPGARDEEPSAHILGPAGLGDDSELHHFLRGIGIKRILTLEQCESYEEFLSLSGVQLNIPVTGEDEETARFLERRLGIPYLPLNAAFNIDRLHEQYCKIADFFGADAIPQLTEHEIALAEEIRIARSSAQNGFTVNGNGSELGHAVTKWLLEEGFRVEHLTLNSWSAEEHEAADAIKCRFPECGIVCSAYQPAISMEPPAKLRESLSMRESYPVGYEQFSFVLNQLSDKGGTA